jgi:hypothetical protein
MGLDKKRLSAIFTFHKPPQMIRSRIASCLHTVKIRRHLAPSIVLIVIGTAKWLKGQEDDRLCRGEVPKGIGRSRAVIMFKV